MTEKTISPPEEILNGLYNLALHAVKHIDEFHPDVLLVLAHGGFAPLWALEAYWEAARPETPLPPICVTNFGREKGKVFDDHIKTVPFRETSAYVGDFDSEINTGYMLHWLTAQKDWHKQLRAQIEGTLNNPVPPDRILVLDEVHYEGAVYRMILYLLELIYPGVQAYSINGGLMDWKPDFANGWLARQGYGHAHEQWAKANKLAYKLVTGTSDIAPESFAWRKTSMADDKLKEAHAAMPQIPWEELPIWVEQTIRQGTKARVQAGQTQPYENVSSFEAKVDVLKPLERALGYLWAQEEATGAEIAQAIGAESVALNADLQRLVDRADLIEIYIEAEPRYAFRPDLWSPHDEFTPRERLDTYWGVMDKILMGRDFDGREAVDMEQMEWLVTQGITCIIACDGQPIENYEYQAVTHWNALKRKHGKHLEYLQVFAAESDIEPYPYAVYSYVRRCLDALKHALERHNIVYLCSSRYAGQAEMIIGCWLVEQHGMTGDEALAEIARQAASSRTNFLRKPTRSVHREMVRNWGKSMRSA